MIMPDLAKTLCWYAVKFLNSALSLLDPQDVHSLARVYGRSLHFDEERPIAQFARHLWDTVATIPNSPELDGEKWLLECTRPFGFTTIFDVGANVGDWARIALQSHPGAIVHCFEIVENTFNQLRDNLAPYGDRVRLNSLGLLDYEGMVNIHISNSHLVSSIYQIEVAPSEKQSIISGAAIKGDDYVYRNDIKEIDFLKIDVEGAEGKVLAGFQECLKQTRIKMLQFEYNRGAVYGGFLLKDVYALLRPLGYVLGKLTPNGVIFREFRVDHEDFSGPNYVACHQSQSSLIAAIAAHGEAADAGAMQGVTAISPAKNGRPIA
jgi:FkbM family methyltransferase